MYDNSTASLIRRLTGSCVSTSTNRARYCPSMMSVTTISNAWSERIEMTCHSTSGNSRPTTGARLSRRLNCSSIVLSQGIAIWRSSCSSVRMSRPISSVPIISETLLKTNRILSILIIYNLQLTLLTSRPLRFEHQRERDADNERKTSENEPTRLPVAQ